MHLQTAPVAHAQAARPSAPPSPSADGEDRAEPAADGPPDAALQSSLLVACDDHTMRTALARTVPHDAVGVHWEAPGLFAGDGLPESAADAIGRHVARDGVRHLYCFSHSEIPEPSVDHAVAGDVVRTKKVKSSLLAGVQLRAARVRRLRSRLAQLVERVAAVPAVAEAIEDGRLIVQGVFYQADSGLFYYCECGQDAFHCVDAQVV